MSSLVPKDALLLSITAAVSSVAHARRDLADAEANLRDDVRLGLQAGCSVAEVAAAACLPRSRVCEIAAEPMESGVTLAAVGAA